MSMELLKVTKCDVQPIYRPRHHTMNNVGWISSEMQAGIEPTHIPLIKLELDDARTTHIIKVIMRRNPSLAESEMYNGNMNMFDDD